MSDTCWESQWTHRLWYFCWTPAITRKHLNSKKNWEWPEQNTSCSFASTTLSISNLHSRVVQSACAELPHPVSSREQLARLPDKCLPGSHSLTELRVGEGGVPPEGIHVTRVDQLALKYFQKLNIRSNEIFVGTCRESWIGRSLAPSTVPANSRPSTMTRRPGLMSSTRFPVWNIFRTEIFSEIKYFPFPDRLR